MYLRLTSNALTFFRKMKTLQFLYGRLNENTGVEVEFSGGFLQFVLEEPCDGAYKRDGNPVVLRIGKNVAAEKLTKTFN